MSGLFISSSILIAALLLLRRIFRDSISRRFQYALWGLVLLRLLIPFNLPGTYNPLPFLSPMNIQAIYQEAINTNQNPAANLDEKQLDSIEQDPSTAQYQLSTSTDANQKQNVPTTENIEKQPAITIDLFTLLKIIWFGGALCTGSLFLVNNLRFWKKLRQTRVPYPIESCKYPVYLIKTGLPSPCLFGIFRPAIYLTPSAINSPEALRYVLTHESTHARHRDPIWAFLRCVCLSLYWFHPLVWIAAITSKTDCELACDESVLHELNAQERLSYGKTLLSLISVSRTPAPPFLTATTMAAGKRQIKSRITRIAENPKTRKTAMAALSLLAGLLCVVTFTEAQSQSRRPLTGEELRYFNEEFFNNNAYNIHNQFLSSLYTSPKEINLYELFYCGSGREETLVDGERQAVAKANDNFDPDCDLTKISAGNLNRVLEENTGLSLAQINRVGIDDLIYLEDYDAYYHFHGDTNYRGEVTFDCGERVGNLIKLYYNDQFMADGWKSLTLKPTNNGGYHFVSNQTCERPVVSVAYPKEKPVLTIPIPTDYVEVTDAKRTRSKLPKEVVMIPYKSNDINGLIHMHTLTDAAETFDFHLEQKALVRTIETIDAADDVNNLDSEAAQNANKNADQTVNPDANIKSDVSNLSVVFWNDVEGNLYAGLDDLRKSSLPSEYFLKIDQEDLKAEYAKEIQISSETNVLGKIGFCIKYPAPKDANIASYTTCYLLDMDGGKLYQIADRSADIHMIDLNGDGEAELFVQPELVTSGSYNENLIFRKNQEFVTADISKLLYAAWPELEYCTAYLDKDARCLQVSGAVSMPDWGPNASAYFQRNIYFNGKELLVYSNLMDTKDHVAVGAIGDTIPEPVRKAVYSQAQSTWESFQKKNPVYDDWRISQFALAKTVADLSCGPVEIYKVDLQFHASRPQDVMLAGAMYVLEDGWTGGLYPMESPYFIFLRSDSGEYTKIKSQLAWDYDKESPYFRADLCQSLLTSGVIGLSDLSGEEFYYMFYMNPVSFLNKLSHYSVSEQDNVLNSLKDYHENGVLDEYKFMFENALETAKSNTNSEELTQEGRAVYKRFIS